MAQDVTATHWVSQSPDRVTAIHERRRMLIRVTEEDHFRRLVLDWAATDDGAFPSRSQAQVAAHYELEVLCGWLGRFAALAPDEVFPRQAPVTIPQELDEGWGQGPQATIDVKTAWTTGSSNLRGRFRPLEAIARGTQCG